MISGRHATTYFEIVKSGSGALFDKISIILYCFALRTAQFQAPRRAPAPVFMAATIVIFFLSLSAADSVGFVPCYVDGPECLPGQSEDGAVALSNLPQLGNEVIPTIEAPEATALPERIVIAKIDLDLPVQNIESRDIDVLYENLKSGPIRYVDSARLGQEG